MRQMPLHKPGEGATLDCTWPTQRDPFESPPEGPRHMVTLSRGAAHYAETEVNRRPSGHAAAEDSQ